MSFFIIISIGIITVSDGVIKNSNFKKKYLYNMYMKLWLLERIR